MKTPLNKNRFWQMGILTVLIGSASQVAFAWECTCIEDNKTSLETIELLNKQVQCKHLESNTTSELAVKKEYGKIQVSSKSNGSKGGGEGSYSGKDEMVTPGFYDVGARQELYSLHSLKDINVDNGNTTSLSGSSYKTVKTSLENISSSADTGSIAYEYTLGLLTLAHCYNKSSFGDCSYDYDTKYDVAAIWEKNSDTDETAVAVCIRGK